MIKKKKQVVAVPDTSRDRLDTVCVPCGYVSRSTLLSHASVLGLIMGEKLSRTCPRCAAHTAHTVVLVKGKKK